MNNETNSGIKTTEMLTRNIAKSGEVHNWSGFTPFKLHLGLIVNRSQSASCHIANVRQNIKTINNKIMKLHRLPLIFVIFYLILSSCSNHIVKWNKWDLAYETPERLHRYRTESKNVNGRDNDNYAVDIEVVHLSDESDEFKNDIKYAAKEIALDMEIKNIQNGDFIPQVDYGYFVTGQDKDSDSTLYPVVIGAIIRESRYVAYEITIDCYNKNIEKGIEIIKSFKLMK